MRKLINKTVILSLLIVLSSSATALAIPTVANERTVAAQARLDAAKLHVCEVHQKVINNIMNRIADRGQRRLDVYSKIAERVEAFYTKKGKTVSNYDTLVADVNAKKSAAQDAVNKVKDDKADFKCDGSDPKGAAASFKDDLKLEIKALHDYQQSIKNLIVAVKSAQSETTSNGTNEQGGEQ